MHLYSIHAYSNALSDVGAERACLRKIFLFHPCLKNKKKIHRTKWTPSKAGIDLDLREITHDVVHVSNCHLVIKLDRWPT